METRTRYELICPKCGQKGELLEVERYEIPDAVASGDCSDDLTVYYYTFKVTGGDFTVVHRDPNSFEHTVLCKRCKVEAKEKKLG